MPTLGLLIDQTRERLREVVPAERLNWATTKQALNSALQDVYIEAVAVYPEFYTKSIAITAGASFTLPADFFQAIFIHAPSAHEGGIRLPKHTDVENLNINTLQAGITSDPMSVVVGNTLEGYPNFSGNETLFYLWNFGTIDDETTEITVPWDGTGPSYLALIPAFYEELIVMNAVSALRMRFAMDADTANLSEMQIQQLTDSVNRLSDLRAPDAVWGRNVSVPAVNTRPPTQDNQ